MEPTNEMTADESIATEHSDQARKERVLHTRVPVVLERELKRFANGLRMPVSNLVRAILEDAVKAADFATESASDTLKRAAEQLEHERVKLGERFRHRATKEALRHVYAFQAVRLAKFTQCAKCDRELDAGSDAFLGLNDATNAREAMPRVFVCTACLPSN